MIFSIIKYYFSSCLLTGSFSYVSYNKRRYYYDGPEKIQELIGRSQQEDAVAFSLLVSTFQPLVFRLAFRLLCDEDEAKDMVQETFVKVWLALGKYNGECRFSTWLYKITCNTCYDRLRSLHHSPLDNEADYSVSANISSDDNVELAVVNKQLRELILRYTDELSPRQRLILHYGILRNWMCRRYKLSPDFLPESLKPPFTWPGRIYETK